MKIQLTELQETTLYNIKEDINNKKDMSIRECSSRNFVSIGFLSKLAKKMGYKGYSEMIFSLSSKKYDNKVDQGKEYIKKYIINYSTEMQEQYEQLILSVKDGYIYCDGKGYSMIAMDYICRKANKNGYNAIYTEALNEIINYNKEVLMIAITNSGESADVVNAIERCKNNHIPTIVFTRNGNSRAARMADLMVLVNKIENEDVSGINSFIGNTINCFEILSSNMMKKQ